jgi:hypothetical protein
VIKPRHWSGTNIVIEATAAVKICTRRNQNSKRLITNRTTEMSSVSQKGGAAQKRYVKPQMIPVAGAPIRNKDSRPNTLEIITAAPTSKGFVEALKISERCRSEKDSL